MSQDPYRYPPSPIGLPPAGAPPTGAPPTPPPGPSPTGSPGDADDIQFDRAESAAPASPAAVAGFQTPPAAAASACAVCARPISDYYFEANGKVLCPACQQAVAASQTGGSAIGRLFRAGLFGAIAGVVGAAVWYGVRRATNYELGIIAVVVGLMVGGAVRKGSDGRGGIGYQILAVLITYIAVCLNYLPDIYTVFSQKSEGEMPGVVIFVIALIFSLGAPFLMGLSNIIGMLIIAFALWEAWKINSKQTIVFNGPYRVGQPGGPPGVGGMMAAGAAPAGMTPAGAPPLYPPPPPPGAWPPPTGGA